MTPPHGQHDDASFIPGPSWTPHHWMTSPVANFLGGGDLATDFRRRKADLYKGLQKSFVFTLLSIYRTYFVFTSVLIGLCAGVNISLSWFINWFQVSREDQNKTMSTFLFFNVLIRSWLLIRLMGEAIRAAIWLLHDAWRPPSQAFQLYRGCLLGRAYPLMLKGDGIAASQLASQGGWKYSHDRPCLERLDMVLQAFIYFTFDIFPFAWAAAVFVQNRNSDNLWQTFQVALNGFQVVACGVAAMHVVLLHMAWVASDLAAKAKGAHTAFRKILRIRRRAAAAAEAAARTASGHTVRRERTEDPDLEEDEEEDDDDEEDSPPGSPLMTPRQEGEGVPLRRSQQAPQAEAGGVKRRASSGGGSAGGAAEAEPGRVKHRSSSGGTAGSAHGASQVELQDASSFHSSQGRSAANLEVAMAKGPSEAVGLERIASESLPQGVSPADVAADAAADGVAAASFDEGGPQVESASTGRSRRSQESAILLDAEEELPMNICILLLFLSQQMWTLQIRVFLYIVGLVLVLILVRDNALKIPFAVILLITVFALMWKHGCAIIDCRHKPDVVPERRAVAATVSQSATPAAEVVELRGCCCCTAITLCFCRLPAWIWGCWRRCTKSPTKDQRNERKWCRPLRHWAEDNCGTSPEAACWQYELLIFATLLQAMVCVLLKWWEGFGIFLAMFVAVTARRLVVRPWRQWCWLFGFLEAFLYALGAGWPFGEKQTMASNVLFMACFGLMVQLTLGRYDTYKLQTYRAAIFLLHLLLLVIVSVCIAAAMQAAAEVHDQAPPPPKDAASLALHDPGRFAFLGVSSAQPDVYDSAAFGNGPGDDVAAAFVGAPPPAPGRDAQVGLPSEYAFCNMSFPLGRDVPYRQFQDNRRCINGTRETWVKDDTDCRSRCTATRGCSFVTQFFNGSCLLSDSCPRQEPAAARIYVKDIGDCADVDFQEGEACDNEAANATRTLTKVRSAKQCGNACVQYGSVFDWDRLTNVCRCWSSCPTQIPSEEFTFGQVCVTRVSQRLSILDFAQVCQMTNLDENSFQDQLQKQLPGWRLVFEHRGADPGWLRRHPDREKDGKDWTTFFELQDPTNTTTIFAVRGTQGPLDVIQDMNIWVSTALMQGASYIGPTLSSSIMETVYHMATAPGSVERNFFPLLRKRVRNQTMRDPSRRFYFTGHSLGGGLATIMALEVGRVAMTFSAPGLKHTAAWMLSTEAQVKPDYEMESKATRLLYNIVPINDIVPTVDVQMSSELRVSCRGSLFKCHTLVSTFDELSRGGCRRLIKVRP